MRRLLVFLRACLIFNGPQNWLRRDLSFRLGGPDGSVLQDSSVVMSVLGMLIGLLI
jgi:hypothetical protein